VEAPPQEGQEKEKEVKEDLEKRFAGGKGGGGGSLGEYICR